MLPVAGFVRSSESIACVAQGEAHERLYWWADVFENWDIQHETNKKCL